jgi:hypothetical protein
MPSLPPATLSELRPDCFLLIVLPACYTTIENVPSTGIRSWTLYGSQSPVSGENGGLQRPQHLSPEGGPEVGFWSYSSHGTKVTVQDKIEHIRKLILLRLLQ